MGQNGEWCGVVFGLEQEERGVGAGRRASVELVPQRENLPVRLCLLACYSGNTRRERWRRRGRGCGRDEGAEVSRC
jgi:hypothetical protein